MRFLVDAQLPPALAKWLGGKSCSAKAVREVGLRESDDGSIRHFAVEGGWILVTKDEEFVRRSLNAPHRLQIVWIRLGNCTNGVLFNSLEKLWPQIVRHLRSGRQIVEVKGRSPGRP